MTGFPGANHIFIGVTLIAGYTLVLLLPPRLPRSVAAIMMMASAAIPLILDHTIGTPPIDLYDTNVKPWLTVSDVLTWCIYPIFGYLFAYFQDRWHVRGLGIPLYVLGWSLIAAAFELLAVACHVFTYKDWSIRYSFILYLVVQLAMFVLFRISMDVFIRARKV